MSEARTWYPLEPGRSTTRGRLVGGPVDPLEGPKLALAGRLVTMSDHKPVRESGVLYLEKGCITDVRDRGDMAPEGFEDVKVIETGGTIYPGLIELHNHLSYNALPLWSTISKVYTNRDQWGKPPPYRKLISGPMTVVGMTPSLIPSLVRYVECKCLLGGVTTSQGIKLMSNAGISRYYRGLIRNVEQTDDPDLPEAHARIGDVVAKDARAFQTMIEKASGKHCMLLHLSEGTDESARKHFLALEVKKDEWAITDALAGIHSAGLQPSDFGILASHGGAMVWSPLSNLLLYGKTADVKAAKAEGVRMGLGSDWAPSGSKNLLGELKVAWLYSEAKGGLFTARELVAMATSVAADILKWGGMLGTLEKGKRADMLVVDSTAGDPYDSLIRARETDIRLVMVGGVARYGSPSLMTKLAPSGEAVQVGGKERSLYLEQATADPDVRKVSLRTARSTLKKAFHDIVKLARALERPSRAIRPAARVLDRAEPVKWTLELDELYDTGMEIRPRLPYAGPTDFTGPSVTPTRAASIPLSKLLEPMTIDPLTVADDPAFLPAIDTRLQKFPDSHVDLASLY